MCSTMCRHLTYIALNVTYLAHVSFSLLSPSSILSYSFTLWTSHPELAPCVLRLVVECGALLISEAVR